MSQERTFVPMIDFEKEYEICTEYPFDIRRIGSDYCIKESPSGNGYIRVSLNGKTYSKHVLIAKQFIHNDDPEHKTEVDHINHDAKDYHLSNLRWVTPSENKYNKASFKGIQYEFVDDIPDDATKVLFYDTCYGHRTFEDGKYYFHDDVFYLFNGIKYRKLHINETKSGNMYVKMLDIDGKQVAVMYSRFKSQHDL